MTALSYWSSSNHSARCTKPAASSDDHHTGPSFVVAAFGGDPTLVLDHEQYIADHSEQTVDGHVIAGHLGTNEGLLDKGFAIDRVVTE